MTSSLVVGYGSEEPLLDQFCDLRQLPETAATHENSAMVSSPMLKLVGQGDIHALSLVRGY
jgi:hypothetical protein